MMTTGKIRITVPGSTSNLGAGFDSIGAALDLFLTINCKKAEKWRFVPISDQLKGIPEGTENIIYQSALHVAKDQGIETLPPYEVELQSEIPLARGLGSSGAAVAAGIELANQILELNLSEKQKVLYATEVEGHPDNVAPSILGGWIVAYYDQKDLTYIQKRKNQRDIVFVAIIPDFELETKKARGILPDSLSFAKSVEASAVANVSVAALFQEDYQTMGMMMDQDLFHQPYRKNLIPHFEELKTYMKEEGAYGTFLSGAGPTILSIIHPQIADGNIKKWRETYPQLNWRVLNLVGHGITTRIFKASSI